MNKTFTKLLVPTLAFSLIGSSHNRESISQAASGAVSNDQVADQLLKWSNPQEDVAQTPKIKLEPGKFVRIHKEDVPLDVTIGYQVSPSPGMNFFGPYAISTISKKSGLLDWMFDWTKKINLDSKPSHSCVAINIEKRVGMAVVCAQGKGETAAFHLYSSGK